MLKTGQPPITGESVVVTGTTQINCNFDLSGRTVGQYSLVVTSSDGQTTSEAFDVYYPPPNITGVNPGYGPIAGGTSITINGSDFVRPGGRATGGTVTDVGGYRIHTFTGSGVFTPEVGMSVEVLVVAGGGGGGSCIGGGGGAGGYIYNSSYSVTAGNSYPVTIGNGGTGGPPGSGQPRGTNGGNSVFNTLTAIGGGGGGSWDSSTPGNGGSGGGSTNNSSAYGSATAGQGNQGGSSAGTGNGGAGGGGAGSAGANSTPSLGGAGGTGRSFDISGASLYYCGGGGGGARTGSATAGAGGSGVGGNGATSGIGQNGVANRGGGGGGGAYDGTYQTGGNGGSGIVIIRYLLGDPIAVKVDGTDAANVNYVSSTAVTAVTPAHAAGPVNVEMINPDGQIATLEGGFTYNSPPAIISITPASGLVGQSVNVTMEVANCLSGAAVKLTRTGAPDINGTFVTLNSPTELAATFDLVGKEPGPWSVVVTNPDTQSGQLAGAFEIRQAAPTVSYINPDTGDTAGGTAVTITGTGFVPAEYLRTVEVTNGGTTLSDYQVMVTLETQSLITAGRMRSDRGDIRFVGTDGVSPLSYWLETTEASVTRLWVKVPSVPAGSSKIYLQYGNASLTSGSNGDATFVFFDDFNGGSLDSTKWNSYVTNNANGSVTVANGIVTLANSTTETSIQTKTSIPNDTIVEFYSKLYGNPQSGGNLYIAYANLGPDLSGKYSSIGYTDFAANYESAVYTGLEVHPPRVSGAASTDGDQITNPTNNAWFYERFYVPAGNYLYRKMNALADQPASGRRYLSNQGGKLKFAAMYGNYYPKWWYIDRVLVRKYAATEPTVNVQPGTIARTIGVDLGGTPVASVAFVNSTTLTATTGAHAQGLVDATVTNPDGQSGTKPTAYSYMDLVGPDLVSGEVRLNISRVGNDIRLTWEAGENPQIYYLSGDGTGQFTTQEGWTRIVNNGILDGAYYPAFSLEASVRRLWHRNQVGQGTTESYYKGLKDGIVALETNADPWAFGGTYLASVKASAKYNRRVEPGYNLFSLPFVPQEKALAFQIGTQLNGTADNNPANSDWVMNFVNDGKVGGVPQYHYTIAWLNSNDNVWYDLNTRTLASPIEIRADISYWIRLMPASATKEVTLIGVTSRTGRLVSVQAGYNPVGSCFAKRASLEGTALANYATRSDSANTACRFLDKTAGGWSFAFPKTNFRWYDLNVPTDYTLIELKPGLGYFVREPDNSGGYTWSYPRPY